MTRVVIVDAVRTAIGRYGGILKDMRPDDMLAFLISELIKRNQQVPLSQIEDVIVGAANQSGEDNRNVARMSALLAGLPVTVPGVTVNRLCASSMEAICQSARAISLNQGDIYIAGGVESMTRAPLVLAKSEQAFAREPKIYDTTLGWRFTNSKLSELHYPYSMGETAENVATKYNISRERQDLFALSSQQKYAKALNNKIFEEEIIPIEISEKKGLKKIICQDEHPRPETSLADLQKLKAAFRENGTVTAGNSSGINDGACALLLMSEAQANNLGLKPLGRIVSTAVAGVDPAYMGIGPVPASQKALERAELKISDIDRFELNEAFAAQVLACCDQLNIPEEKLNVNGGAIALGHPLGMSGARIITTLLKELRRKNLKYGLASMCIGVGQGMATIVESI